MALEYYIYIPSALKCVLLILRCLSYNIFTFILFRTGSRILHFGLHLLIKEFFIYLLNYLLYILLFL